MTKREPFTDLIKKAYAFRGPSIQIGGAMLDGEALVDHPIRIPLKTLNRHGLIAGATGTGKTKTLQVLAEQLSREGVPSLLMDIKGDLSGIAAAADDNPKLHERNARIGIPFTAGSSPVEFLTLSDEPGARLRATVTEFGPVLFSRMLDLTAAQTGIMSIVFKFCDDKGLPLLDLNDLRRTLQYMLEDGKEEVKREYGQVSTVSAGAILRKIVQLEQQGASRFFGEPSFDVQDLARVDGNGYGMVSIVRLTDMQDRPALFSTFMMELLAEVYHAFPEAGDPERPRLVLFIDEAHLVFKQASDALLGQLELIVKLIRSKGVGIIFVTQNPADIPEDVLGQLGLKVQHALRAFTAKDRKAIRLAAQNFPLTEFYEVDQLLTSMGIGEALVSALNEKGIPTPLSHTLLRAPMSRMDILTEDEIAEILKRSRLGEKYNLSVDRQSAKEMLEAKMEKAREASSRRREEFERTRRSTRNRKEKSVVGEILSSPVSRQVTRTVTREITRGLLRVLGVRS